MHLEARYEGIGRIVARETKVEDPGPGQVRVRVERCGICGSDLDSNDFSAANDRDAASLD